MKFGLKYYNYPTNKKLKILADICLTISFAAMGFDAITSNPQYKEIFTWIAIAGTAFKIFTKYTTSKNVNSIK